MSDARSKVTSNPSGKRAVLADIVPMEQPLAIYLSPSNLCNFRCEYCSHSTPEYKVKHGHKVMSMELYRRIADDISSSFGCIKCLALTTDSEPLTNPNIADMIAYARNKGISETLELYTNGALLTEELSLKLIRAGLTRTRISVNALQDDDFIKYCGVKYSFDSFVRNVTFLFNNRGRMEVYIKILNYMVNSEERKKRFFDVFEPISDRIGIQALLKSVKTIDYESIAGENHDFSETMSMVEKRTGVSVCPLPFYTLRISEDGDVFPCCGSMDVETIGNICDNSLDEIWKVHAREFQRKMLDGYEFIDSCKGCTYVPYSVSFDEDYLDDKVDLIKLRY